MTRAPDDPTRPLSVVELEVAALAGRGYGIKRIATAHQLKATTVASIVNRIALKIPNPDELHPLTLVQLWAAHRRWLTEHDTPHDGKAA